MSSYYLTARNHNKALKIPIESKHIYFDNDTTTTYSISQNGMAGQSEKCYVQNIYKLWTANEFSLNRGTGPDEFIGDKIQLKSVLFQLRFVLSHYPYQPLEATTYSNLGKINTSAYKTGTLANGSGAVYSYDIIKNDTWFRTYRLLLVHFDKDDQFDDSQVNDVNFRTNIAHWFNSIYVPLQYNSGGDAADGFTHKTTNQANILRESTIYNKQYKIIKDWSFTLSGKKPTHTVQFQLDPKRQLNLKPNADNQIVPTDDWFRDTYLILITPVCEHDMDPPSYAYYDTSTSQNIEVKFDKIIKYTWYDV